MNMKKLISMVLALVMLLAMSTTAMAETYTISAPDNGHIYEVYQIFTGELFDGVLSNICWGKNGTGVLNEEVSDEILEEIEDVNGNDKTDTEKLAVILKYAQLNAENKFGVATSEAALKNVPAGYYLIKDVDGAFEDEYDSYTTYVVKVVSNVTISPKSSVPEVEKKVDDKNDSNTKEDGENWQDSADYDIGDEVPFKLTATLGDNLTGYETYKIVFHDTLSAGLTYYKNTEDTTDTKNYKVTIDGVDVTEKFVDSYSGTNLTFTCDDVLELGAEEGSEIVVEYFATLNKNAVIGAAGNPNEVYLEFTNNPNTETETGKTPSDKVIVFTYKVIVNKVDENNQELAKAGFTLYKKNASGEYVAVGNELKGDQMTQFVWEGLDDGDYKLSETTTPPGYNTIEDIEFTISAEHDEKADAPALTKLKGGDLFTGNVSTGALTGDVVNEKGATLPETGAQGTKMIYIAGGILVAAAVILLITKRRMNSAE